MQDGCQKQYHRHLCPVFKCHLQTDLLSTIRNPDMSGFQIPTVVLLGLRISKNHQALKLLLTNLVFHITGLPEHSRLPFTRCRSNVSQISDQQMSASILLLSRCSSTSPAYALHAQKAHRKMESGTVRIQLTDTQLPGLRLFGCLP